jgi:hypothetical protein
MLGCPLVLKGSKLAAFRAVEIYQKIPGVLSHLSIQSRLVARIKSRKEADQVVLPPLNSDWPDGEWPISLTERTVPTAIVKSNTAFGG